MDDLLKTKYYVQLSNTGEEALSVPDGACDCSGFADERHFALRRNACIPRFCPVRIAGDFFLVVASSMPVAASRRLSGLCTTCAVPYSYVILCHALGSNDMESAALIWLIEKTESSIVLPPRVLLGEKHSDLNCMTKVLHLLIDLHDGSIGVWDLEKSCETENRPADRVDNSPHFIGMNQHMIFPECGILGARLWPRFDFRMILFVVVKKTSTRSALLNAVSRSSCDSPKAILQYR